MIARNGVRPNRFTALFFHAATVFMVLFLIFLGASLIAGERLLEPWSGVGAVSFVGFVTCRIIYSTAIDRKHAERTGTTRRQHRTAALALVVIATSTVIMIAAQWMDLFDSSWLLPLIIAYFLFNFGYVYSVARGNLRTNGARLGLGAVMLNLLAMFLSDLTAIWTLFLACAVLAALVGAFLHFRDARGVTA